MANLTMTNWYIKDKTPYIVIGTAGENNATSITIQCDEIIENADYFLDIGDTQNDIFNTQELTIKQQTMPTGEVINILSLQPMRSFLGKEGIKLLQVRCEYMDNDEKITKESNVIHAVVNKNSGFIYKFDIAVFQQYFNQIKALANKVSQMISNMTLDKLQDTNIVTPTDGQVIKYDAETQKWVNGDSGASSLSDLSDTSISSPQSGDVLVYDGEKWENEGQIGNLTPQMFGAKGDGVTDDTQAFHDAIIAANGRPLFVPEGTYIVSSCSVTGVPVNLIGIGNPTIKYTFIDTDYTGIFNIHNAPKINISGITFDGNRLILAETKNVHCIWMYDSNNVTISDCVFQNVSREAMTFYGANKNIHIINNYFNYTSALTWITEDAYVDGFVFAQNIAYNTRTHGVEFEGSVDPFSKDITISDNKFVNVTQTAFVLESVKNVTIANNTVKGSSCAIRLSLVDADNDANEDILIIDNYFDVGRPVENSNASKVCADGVTFKNCIFKANNAMILTYYDNILIDGCTFISTIPASTTLIMLTRCAKAEIMNTFIETVNVGSATQLIQVGAGCSVNIVNVRCKSTVKLLEIGDGGAVTVDTATANIGDIPRYVKARVSSAINVTDLATTIPDLANAQYNAFTFFTIGDIGKLTLSADTTINNIWSDCKYQGRTIIVVLAGGFNLTLTNAGNIMTKSGNDLVISNFVKLTYVGAKWVES